MAACDALRALGFATLASRVSARMATVELREEETSAVMAMPHLVIDAPYSEAIQAIPGRRWDGEAHVHRVFLPSEPALQSPMRLVIDRSTSQESCELRVASCETDHADNTNPDSMNYADAGGIA